MRDGLGNADQRTGRKRDLYLSLRTPIETQIKEGEYRDVKINQNSKEKDSEKKYHRPNFRIEDYRLDVLVESGVPTMKFRKAPDDAKLWKAATYLKAWGARLWEVDEEILDLTIGGESESRGLAETKGDYLEYVHCDVN